MQSRLAMSIRQKQTIDQCLKQDTISTRMFQQKPNHSQYYNQSGVSILTDVFEVYMLQVKVNRRNYNSYSTVKIGAIKMSVIYL